MRFWKPAVAALCVALTPALVLAAGEAPKGKPSLIRQAEGRKPVVFRDRTLANGLRVLTSENHRTPTVAIYVFYKVGSKDDPMGRSGFAHLFEHMMFKSTKNMASENMDRLTEDVGGENNAYTSDDTTVYHETVPSNYLETLLWAEAERMANLNVDETNFASERDVVKEEFRQSNLAPPYGQLELFIAKDSWTTHPYKRPGIGSIEELDAAKIDDVRAFHKTFYRPDNATLVVVGDFDPVQIDAYVDKYFARVAKPEGEIPRVTVKEPERKGEKRFDTAVPNVPLPALVHTYLTPGITSDDTEALQVADTILSSGESSRLYRSLVYAQQVASEANSYADLRTDGGLFVFQITAAGGKSLETVEKALGVEIERLRNQPVTAEELKKAKNQLLTRVLRGLETSDGIAGELGNAAVLEGDPNRINTDIDRLLAVTVEDVQRVAKKYFDKRNRVAIRYSALKETAK